MQSSIQIGWDDKKYELDYEKMNNILLTSIYQFHKQKAFDGINICNNHQFQYTSILPTSKRDHYIDDIIYAN